MNQKESFFSRLEAALGGGGQQSRDVMSEVRADFSAQVEALQREGLAEGEAVERVLDQMGEPEILASEMRGELAPVSWGWVRAVRYFIGGALIVWTLVLLWTIRAWDYGFSFQPAVMVALHLPLILLLWPGIVWRRNWLFGLAPAVLVFFVAFALNAMGTGAGETISLHVDDAVPLVESVEEGGFRWQMGVLIGVSGVVLVLLFGAMQQVRQRHILLGALVLPILAVEIAFHWEEGQFREQRDELSRLLTDPASKIPSAGTFAEAGVGGPERVGATYRLGEDGKGFTMWWSRPLSSGFAVCYSSEDERIWIND